MVLRSGQWTWVMHLLGEMLEVAVQPNVFWLFMNKTAALLRIQSFIQMALLPSGLYLWLCYQLLRKGISMARGTSTAWHCSWRGQRLRLQRCYQRAYGWRSTHLPLAFSKIFTPMLSSPRLAKKDTNGKGPLVFWRWWQLQRHRILRQFFNARIFLLELWAPSWGDDIWS